MALRPALATAGAFNELVINFPPLFHAQPLLQANELVEMQAYTLAFRKGQRERFKLKGSGNFLVFLGHTNGPLAAGFDHFDARQCFADWYHVIHHSLPKSNGNVESYTPVESVFSTTKDSPESYHSGQRIAATDLAPPTPRNPAIRAQQRGSIVTATSEESTG
ncbi:hypothetical protein NKH34_12200 [Mesorhizobium sp. M1148]|uniref:hypothetical protein n=1 Tax=unclassified Mesorhizobium TaxID=325217 RepID=UPI00333539FE